jgi:hypothetical protein
MRNWHDDKAKMSDSCFFAMETVSFLSMKPVDVSRDWRVVLGLAMLAIGAANWLVGRQRTEQYNGYVAALPENAAEQSYRSFDELGTADAVLEPFTDEERRVSYATARRDFYHATFLTGQALVICGAIVTCLGFLGLIKRDASHVTARRLDLRSLGQGPPAV